MVAKNQQDTYEHASNPTKPVFAVGLASTGALVAIATVGGWQMPRGYDHSLDATVCLLAMLGALGYAMFTRDKRSRTGSVMLGLAIFLALSLAAALATAVIARSAVPLVDLQLAAIDQALFPFLDWGDSTRWLASHSLLYVCARTLYISIEWQPILAIFIGAIVIGRVHVERFVAEWGIALLACAATFSRLPALGPYRHFGISEAELPQRHVELPFTYPVKLEQLRSGAIDSLGTDAISGLVTIPSFHACAAVLFMRAFWPIRWLRWPFVAINAGVILATPAIGGHYFIDIPAGILVAVGAILVARAIVPDDTTTPWVPQASRGRPLEPRLGGI